ncbi:hypothetical protein BDV59DRAFT_183595 [Aspergillus ambiguus]|uniref:uncharacterized protein n=1 Tax=Aspergillus ambiguus TaxID=176160 RepID=UPI003CCCF307
MSADLFAEFGVGAPPNQTAKNQSQSSSRSQTGSLIPGLESVQDAPSSTFGQLNAPSPLRSRSDSFGEFNSPQSATYNQGGDVLFDATLEDVPDDESEEWGEFETADATSSQTAAARVSQPKRFVAEPVNKPTSPPSRSPGLTNQLDLLDSLTLEDKPSAPNKPRSAHVDGGARATNKPVSPSASKILAPDDPFEEWDDFVDGPPAEVPKPTPNPRPFSCQPTKPEVKSPQPFGAVGSPTPAAQVRPTNIPPPSVLLGLFPRLFEQLREEATTVRRGPQQPELMDDVASKVTCVLKAAARVVAGRTFRWKRDTILSQSMKIGPARAGKTGGMKLNTVNKNEDIKEQQEALDVINMWRERAALFNAVIQASGRRPVHIISENTRVTTATSAQGAIKASHACALCGLKRDERLPKLDESVEDSFGEWWTDHWGHTDCRRFWESNMGMLRQR